MRTALELSLVTLRFLTLPVEVGRERREGEEGGRGGRERREGEEGGRGGRERREEEGGRGGRERRE